VDRTGSATHVPVVIVGEEAFIDFNEDIATRILNYKAKTALKQKGSL
jgi:hypothetical protein